MSPSSKVFLRFTSPNQESESRSSVLKDHLIVIFRANGHRNSWLSISEFRTGGLVDY